MNEKALFCHFDRREKSVTSIFITLQDFSLRFEMTVLASFRSGTN